MNTKKNSMLSLFLAMNGVMTQIRSKDTHTISANNYDAFHGEVSSKRTRVGIETKQSDASIFAYMSAAASWDGFLFACYKHFDTFLHRCVRDYIQYTFLP